MDWTLLTDEGLDFLVLPLILYVISVGIVWMLSVSLTIGMFVFEATANKMVMKFVSVTLTGAMTWSEWLMSGLQKLPGIVAGVLIIISCTTCGGLALSIGTIFYFFKLTKMSQDFIEDILWKIGKKIMIRIKRMFYKERKAVSSQQNTILVATEGNSAPEVAGGTVDALQGNQENHSIEHLTENNGVDKAMTEDIGQTSSDNSNDGSTDENNTTNENIALIENQRSSSESRNEADETGPHTNDRNWIVQLLENDEIFFHFTIFLLWSLVSLINIPTVLIWAHNYKYSKFLPNDPSFFAGTVLSVCALALWQCDFPKTKRHGYKEIGHLVFGAAVIALIFCPISVYRLNYILSTLIATLILHQLLAPNRIIEADGDDKKDDEFSFRTIFEKIKEKLE